MTSSPGQPQIGHYALVRELARGGMGVVYEGYDRRLDRPVAIKVMLADQRDPQAIPRFLREARAVAGLQHANIVRVYDVGELQGSHYMVLDLVQGESLQRRLEREGTLSEQEAARITGGVARALAYAHAQGILHRDVKPHNVLLDREGRPKLTDFGIAKVGQEQETKAAHDPTQYAEVQIAVAPQLTQEGEVLGTPAFMSPEQADGNQLDARTDIYSLGAMLYALLTGSAPFDEPNLVNLLVAVLTQEPAPPRSRRPDLDPALEAICLKAMAKDPDDRYPDATAMAEALEAYAAGDADDDGGGDDARASTTSSGVRRRSSRSSRSPRAGRTRPPASSGVPPAAVAAIAVPAVVLLGLFLLRSPKKQVVDDPTPSVEIAGAAATLDSKPPPELGPSAAPASRSPSPEPEPSPSPSPSPEVEPSPEPEPAPSSDAPPPAPEKSVKEIFQEARQAAKEGRTAAAWDLLVALGERAPTHVRRARLMVRVGLEARKPPQAVLAVLDRAIAARPKKAGLRIDRGLLWRALKRYDKALVDFEAALRLRPKSDPFSFLVMDAAVKAKRFERVLELLEALVERHPQGQLRLEAPGLRGKQPIQLQLHLARAKLRHALKRPGVVEDLELALREMPGTHPGRAEAEALLAKVEPAQKRKKKRNKRKRGKKRKTPKTKRLRGGVTAHGKIYGRDVGTTFQDHPPKAPVTALRMRFGAWVDGIQLVWGAQQAKTWHGGPGGSPGQVTLQKGEYIKAISGRYGDWINQVTLHTNRRRIGPIGAAGGDHAFALEAPAGHEVCGLRGRATSEFLVGLGILVRKR